MLHRFASASILAVWLVLFAVDMGDDSGLIDYLPTDIIQSVDAVLADFGQAIKISDDSEVAVSPGPSRQSRAAYLSLPQHAGIPSVPGLSLHSVGQGTGLLKKHSKIHQLHQVFLI